jgi:alpha-N-arabinofuranosidase
VGCEYHLIPPPTQSAFYAEHCLTPLSSPQPDLISFTANPADTTPSVSYPIIQLLAAHRITHTLPVTSTDSFGPAYWVAGRGSSEGSHILKAAVYNSTGDVPVSVSFEGGNGKKGDRAQLTVLTAPDGPWAHNTPENKGAVKTTVTTLKAGRGGVFEFSLPDLSVAVLVTEGDR